MGRPRSPQAHSGSTATSTSKVESCPRQLGGRVSIRGRGIRTARQPDCRCNAAWCAMPSPHTSTPTDSPYDSATPEVMAKVEIANLASAYTEPLLVTTQRPGVLSPDSEPQATPCVSQSLPRPYPPGTGVSWDNANHHPTYPPVRVDVGITTTEHPSANAPTVERPLATSTTGSPPIDANSWRAIGG
ncbi:hypothetical protein BHE74_00015517 [Ensete ventricosum]|nr:hypothetical protein BHE74_00015517 [Ensete ventricosum]